MLRPIIKASRASFIGVFEPFRGREGRFCCDCLVPAVERVNAGEGIVVMTYYYFGAGRGRAEIHLPIPVAEDGTCAGVTTRRVGNKLAMWPIFQVKICGMAWMTATSPIRRS